VAVGFYRTRGKRAFDLAVAVPCLALGWPLLAALAVLTRFWMGSPVLYRQVRPGLGGAPFTILKFRTMRDARDASGRPLPDAERLTRFGTWMRAASLDELPELINVVRGDMSLVGPRPLLMQYLDRYSPEQFRRHEVRPGLTGLAQVAGRNLVSWEQRFALDVEYVDRCSLRLDVGILARTVAIVLRREGIAAEGHASMPEFQGSGASGSSGRARTRTTP